MVANPKFDPNNRSIILELRHIARYFGSGKDALHILKDCNMAVTQGELIALVAPSGAGKSTLLHTAGLLEKPEAGEVMVAGQSAEHLDDRARTKMRRENIGFVYQFHHLLPEFTAQENIAIPQMIAGNTRNEAMARASELLDYMKLQERADHRPAELSGGEQQRVAIARAVANSPSILLADEPTGNLDPKTSEFVFDMLNDLVRVSGLAAIIATHNHDLARKMDRCLTLDAGQVIELEL